MLSAERRRRGDEALLPGVELGIRGGNVGGHSQTPFSKRGAASGTHRRNYSRPRRLRMAASASFLMKSTDADTNPRSLMLPVTSSQMS